MALTAPLAVFGDPLRPLRAARSWLGDAEGRRHRRVVVNENRAHIEVRGGDSSDHAPLRAQLKEALGRLDGVDWAEIDAVVGRAVILFDPEAIELDDLLSVVEDVEEAHGVAEERFPHDRADHPADPQPIQRHAFAFVADTLGLGVAAAAQAMQFAGIPAEIPGAVSLLEAQPRVRRFLENRLGPPATDVLLAGTSAVAQALGQGPLGLLVDMGHRGSLMSEQVARRGVWERREPELIEGPHSVRHDALVVSPRPARPQPSPSCAGRRQQPSAGRLRLNHEWLSCSASSTCGGKRPSGRLTAGGPKTR